MGIIKTKEDIIAKQDVFLAEYAETGSMRMACKKAKIKSRGNVYYYIKSDPVFAKKFEEAREEAKSNIEDELYERARKSDIVLIFLAKGNLPDKYGDKKDINLGGNVNVSMTMILEDTDGENA